jgi:hypothetical protein
MSNTEIAPQRLHICSLEDEPRTIAGPLSSLGFHGHQIARCENLSTAREVLSECDIDMLLADEHVAGDQDAGTNLIAELKAGEFGPRNINAAFGFITGSRSWVDEKRVSGYTGYLGVLVKGDGLTTKLESWAKTVRTGIYEGEGPRKLRRIPVYVEGVEFAEDEPMNVLLSIPAWDVEEKVPFPVAKVPVQMQDRLDQLVDRWFIARVSLYEPNPEEIVIRDWEIQEPLRDDDGFA